MFHHNDGVAQIAQMLQRRQQLVIVPLVKADARLIQDVGDADESGSDLRRQPDPLRLAAGQRRRRPRERQIIQSDINQEADAGGFPSGSALRSSPAAPKASDPSETPQSDPPACRDLIDVLIRRP
jgi:hypothetical protein